MENLVASSILYFRLGFSFPRGIIEEIERAYFVQGRPMKRKSHFSIDQDVQIYQRGARDPS